MPQIVALPRIVVVGSTMIDLVAYTSRVPGPGETLVGDRFAMGFGGKGANQAVMARLLGAEVAMVNRVGDDPYGEMIRTNLARYGIDVTNVRPVPGTASGVAPIWVEPDGTNRIIIIPGANHRLTAAEASAAVAALAPRAVALGQFEIPQEVTAAAFAAAREQGAVTILNPAPGAPLLPALQAVSDWIIPNQVELAELVPGGDTGDAALAAAADRLGTGLVVTLGAEGAALVTAAGAVVRHPAPRVTPVDTTGAGDAFVGAFAFGLAAGLDPERSLRLGILCAADSVTRPGTQTSFPPPAAAAALLAQASAG